MRGKYLVEVPSYYLMGRPDALMGRPDAQPDHFASTFYISYRNKKGQTLTGPAGFTTAIQDGYFQFIA